jgi:undecaprenyl-diphosphatase
VSSLQALVLGAVQGLTEFIPISSSGHLVLVPEVLGWQESGLAFDVLLHAASLVALLAYFWRDLRDLATGSLRGEPQARRMVWLLAIGTMPAGLAGVFLGDFFEDQFSDATASAWQLLATAVILVAAEQALRFHSRRVGRQNKRLREVGDLRSGDALAVGVAQAVSILPGISRSGATIATGLGLAMERDAAARFAFLLAIPALFGAMIVELPELKGSALGFGAGAAGFLGSLVTSYAAIWGLIRYLKTKTLYPFAAYCVVATFVFLALI